ncbi:MAG: ABC transporter ATP-binding protein/permease [Planctomycetes bacterium]|nr:ABC transporter ATP-binding protein/permease [Planctomycetota bacterium]
MDHPKSDDTGGMRDFWWFARGLLRPRHEAIIALIGAFISAGGLGAGLLSLGPLMQLILRDGTSLQQILRNFNARGEWIQAPEWIIGLMPTTPYGGVVCLLVGLCVLTVFGAAANFIHQLVAMGLCARTTAKIRLEIFRHVIHLPLSVVTKQGPAEFTSRINNDVTMLNSGFEALTSKTIAQLTKGVAALAAALYFDWRLVLVSCTVGPILAVVLRKTGKSIRKGTRGALEAQESLLRTTQESMQGLRTMKGSTAELESIRRFALFNHKVLRQNLRVRKSRALSGPLIEMLAIFVVAGLALIAAKSILGGELSFENFLLSLGALAVCANSLKPLTGFINEFQATAAPAARLRSILKIPREDKNETGKPGLKRHAQSIKFEGVVFAYPNAPQPALAGVNFSVLHGERVAIVGSNGCGKTTLLSMVPRLLTPTGGRILVDDVDIQGIDLKSLRRQIGLVTQESVLIQGTIYENIRLGFRRANRAEVETAAKRARAWDFISAIPGGLDGHVSEQGASLSGGQRQRIAIARAILRDPAILLMDEATSQVDAESEEQINKAIAEFGVGRTVLVVAHRLSTVLAADRIVVMDFGRVVDMGTHAELLKRCDVYRRIAATQMLTPEVAVR